MYLYHAASGRYRKKRNQKTFPVDREHLLLWQGNQPEDGVYLYHAASGQAGKETNRNSKPPSQTDGGFFKMLSGNRLWWTTEKKVCRE